jgi:sec-independent protein translocase protein TatC
MTARKREERNDEKRMPFLDHLEELRWRLIKCIAAVMILTVVSYLFSGQLLSFLTRPFPAGRKLIFLSPAEGFIIRMKISLFGGIIFGLPVIFYQMWQFIAPGLLPHEKKYVPHIILISSFNFAVGALFAYFVIVPIGLNFLLSFETPDIEATIRIRDYLGFVTNMMLAFGVVFELPVLSFLLARIGIITPEFMARYRRYAIVLIFVVAAILTPPDVFSQILLALPLLVLYEVSIVVARVARRRRTKAATSEAPQEPEPSPSHIEEAAPEPGAQD